MYKVFSKILPSVISILLFSSAFVYYAVNSSDSEKRLLLSPEIASYTDKYKVEISYTGNDITEDGFIKNVRVNQYAGVSEPFLVCSPENENILAVAANNFSVKDNYATIFISLDKGINWTEKHIPLSSKFENSFYSDPFLEFDFDGNLVFTAVQKDLHNRSRRGLCFSKSTDNGNSWKTNFDFVVYSLKENTHVDKPGMVTGKTSADKNLVFISWTEFKGLKSFVMFKKSTDGGLTFHSASEVEGNNVRFGSILCNDTGELFAVYLKNDSEIRIKKSFDKGESWKDINSFVTLNPSGKFSDGQFLIKNTSGNGIRINSYPHIIFNRDSDLLLTYSAQENNEDISDIYFCKFINSTSEFTSPVKVNSDNTNCDQFLPAISKDESGNIFIIYQDSREDESNLLTDTYLSYSEDGGNNFTDKKLSLKSFNPKDISVGNYLSDYNSCVFSGGKLIAIWTDGRNSNYDLYAGIFNYNEFINH